MYHVYLGFTLGFLECVKFQVALELRIGCPNLRFSGFQQQYHGDFI